VLSNCDFGGCITICDGDNRILLGRRGVCERKMSNNGHEGRVRFGSGEGKGGYSLRRKEKATAISEVGGVGVGGAQGLGFWLVWGGWRWK